MEFTVFAVVCVILYFVSDRILDAIEVRRGDRFEHRSLVFLGILGVLAVIAFQIIGYIMAP